MEVENYITELDSMKRQIRNRESDDLRRLKERWGPMNQRLTILLSAMNAIRGTRGDIKFLRSLINNDRYEIPLDEILKIANDTFEQQSSMYEVRFHLLDTADLLSDVNQLCQNTDDIDEINDALKSTQEYLAYFEYQIGAIIPFHDLGVAFEGRMSMDNVFIRCNL